MAHVLRIVDPDDLATVFWDFYDAAGATNPQGVTCSVRSLDLGTSANRVNVLETGQQSIVTAKEQQHHQMKVVLKVSAASHAALDAGIGELRRLLNGEGVLRWQRNGATEATFISFLDGVVPPLLRGQGVQDERQILDDKLDRELPIEIMCQPTSRGAELPGDGEGANKLTNSLLILDTANDGRPDGWTWDATTNISAELINSALDAYQFDFAAAAASHILSQTYTGTAVGETWTFSLYGRVVSGPGDWKLRLRFLDSGGTPLGSDTDSAAQTGDEFTRAQVSAVAPASTAKVKVSVVYTGTAGGVTQFASRMAQVEEAAAATGFRGGAETVSGDPAASATHGLIYPVFVQGDAPAPVRFKVKVNAGADVQQVAMAMMPSGGTEGTRALADVLNKVRLWQLEGGTLYNGAALAADTDASPGTGNTCISFAPSNGNKRFVRVTKTDALDALRGTWDVWARVKITELGKIRFQMRYGCSSQDPCPNAGPEVTHDTTVGGSQLTSFGWVMLPLGRIVIPPEQTLSQITLELWARDADNPGDTTTKADLYLLLPASDSGALGPGDQQGAIAAPYSSRDSTLGKDLLSLADTAPVDGNSRVLAAWQDEVHQERTGMGAGRYRVSWRYSLRDGAVADDYEFTAERTTGGAVTVKAQLSDETTDVNNRAISVEFDNAATSNVWLLSVTAVPNPTVGILTVHEQVVEYVPYAVAGESLLTDPRAESLGVWKVNSFDQAVAEWAQGGPTPFWLPPGLSLVTVIPLSPRVGGLYAELESQLDASLTLSYTHAPHYRT